MVINLIVVVGLYVFVGVSGVFSFGQVSFMAIGAYTTGILSIPSGTKDVIFLSMPPRAPSCPRRQRRGRARGRRASAAVVALVFALPLSRLSGLVAGLGTFAFLLIVNVVAGAWTAVTNGTTGMSAIPVSTTLTRALPFAFAAILVAFAYQESRFGRRLRTSREDEVAVPRRRRQRRLRAQPRLRHSAPSSSGSPAACTPQYLGSIDPSAFFLNTTFLTIAMLVVGGMTSLSGAVIGTIFISAWWPSSCGESRRASTSARRFVSRRRPGLQEVGLGVLMLAGADLAPAGADERARRWRCPP